MNFNSIVFPSPKFDFKKVKIYSDELIYIPANNNDYIPCLFLEDKSNKLSKNFIIMFHGNAEDIFGARTMGDNLRQRMLMNVVIVEYPGYSIYNGDQDADKMLENTLIVYDYIKTKFNLEDSNIYIFGRSIGTSPAIYLASKKNPNALFTVSAFSRIKAVAKNLVGFLNVLVKDRFTSIDYIKTVKCPTILIHGQKDPLIPFEETLLLKENIDCPYEVVLPEEMTHNDFDLEIDIVTPINNFIAKNCVVDKTPNDFKQNEEMLKDLFEMPKSIRDFVDSKLK